MLSWLSIKVACDVEDGDLLFWLPAVVTRHAEADGTSENPGAAGQVHLMNCSSIFSLYIICTLCFVGLLFWGDSN
jgi:hypothetical protein